MRSHAKPSAPAVACARAAGLTPALTPALARALARAVILALLISPLTSVPSAAASVTPPSTGSPIISQATMDAAVETLRHDPNLGGQTKTRTLRWITKSQPAPPPTSPSWLAGLFDYIGQFGGLLLWAIGAAAVATAAIWILRLIKSRTPRTAAAESEAVPRHVLALDIRPASLPKDVSATAKELLRAGRLRDCLSLLYRGSLSAAVHRFGATLGAQHTEREVLKAVNVALDDARARYFAELIATWQRVVYAGEAVSSEAVLPLCTGFATHFDRPAS